MNPIHLNERAVKVSAYRTERRFSWPADVSLSTPFWLEDQLSYVDDRFFDEPFSYRAIGFEHGRFLWVAVRTDAYPLIWLWAWFKWRWDKTMEMLPALAVYVLEIWGLAYCGNGSRPCWRDIGRRSLNPIPYPKRP